MAVTLVGLCAVPRPFILSDICFDDRTDVGMPHREAAIRVCYRWKGIIPRFAEECQERAVVFLVFRSTAIVVGLICVSIENYIRWNSHVPGNCQRSKQFALTVCGYNVTTQTPKFIYFVEKIKA